MADEFVVLVPLENGETVDLGDKLNGQFEALETAANLAFRYRRDINDGEWDEAAPYKLGDVVFWADAYWHALNANSMSEPDSSNANWRKIGSGGGTGGGHIIKQDDGSNMTQRAGLQFEGDDLTLADDAAGNKTIVSVARKIAVFLSGIAKGVQGKLNFIAGDNLSITATENTGTGSIDVLISAITSATQWRRGEGAPSNSLGVAGDFYLDTLTSIIYQKVDATYSNIGTFKGAKGDTGATGTIWRDGAGAPSNSTGVDGDYWVDSSNGAGKGNVYKKVAGSYGSPIFNIKGVDGVFSAIASQAQAEAGTDNVTGMTPLRTAQEIKALVPIVWEYPLSDEGTTITAGAAKVTDRARHAVVWTNVVASLTAASTSGAVTVNIKKNGASIFSTKLTIDANEKTSVSADVQMVLSSTAMAFDDEIVIDLDTAGTGAKGLKVALIGRLP